MYSRYAPKRTGIAAAVAAALPKPAPSNPVDGRVFTTEFTFRLTWRERLKVLIGGHMTIVSRITTMPGQEGQATEGWKICRWPWE